VVKTSWILPAAIALATALIVGGIVDTCGDRSHTKDLAELNNQIAAAESTRQIAEGAWARRLFVATDKLKMADLDRQGALEELERLELEKRGLYNLAIHYRAQLVGTSVARADSLDSVIPIDLADGSAHARGEVRVRDHQIPAATAIEVALDIWIDRFLLSLAIGEAEDGSLTAVAKSADPHVTKIEIEGITDLRTTGLGSDGPSRLKWLGIGGAAGAILSLVFGK
jgi:hypothetical protein